MEPDCDPMASTIDKGFGELDAAIVDQTLNEILADSEPNFPKVGPSDATL